MGAVRLLVVDDEDMIRWSIERTLGKGEFEVVSAGSAAEAVRLFREFRPQVVLLDVRLPDSNGFVLLEQFRKEADWPVSVIIMTAFEECCSAEQAAESGAVAFLRKPFDFDHLEDEIFRVVPAAA